jgi:hypothetical protein
MRPKREAQLGLSATTFLLLCISFGPDRACFIIAIVLRALRSRNRGRHKKRDPRRNVEAIEKQKTPPGPVFRTNENVD